MKTRRKKTPLEIWETGKRNAGRPRKITPEEDWLLDELVDILVDVYLDEVKRVPSIVSDIVPQAELHTRHKVEISLEHLDTYDHVPILRDGLHNRV